ncbi:hypothetical protein [Cerasicoccus frondis]|uniref:hypothetical protein n=1 Tax=Cerasicoccus frondis TaxID=490090 RepID=UPI00285280A7|nr:hypothetical protein [Cerasicoccus frondis]
MPSDLLFKYRPVTEIFGRLALLILIGAPVLAGLCVAHNRWERRTRLVVVDYGVWVERVGRGSRLYRWSEIEHAVSVRKGGSLGLSVRNKLLPITISGFNYEARSRFVRLVKEGQGRSTTATSSSPDVRSQVVDHQRGLLVSGAD